MDLSRHLQRYRLKLLIIFVSLLKGQKYKTTFWKKKENTILPSVEKHEILQKDFMQINFA